MPDRINIHVGKDFVNGCTSVIHRDEKNVGLLCWVWSPCRYLMELDPTHPEAERAYTCNKLIEMARPLVAPVTLGTLSGVLGGLGYVWGLEDLDHYFDYEIEPGDSKRLTCILRSCRMREE